MWPLGSKCISSLFGVAKHVTQKPQVVYITVEEGNQRARQVASEIFKQLAKEQKARSAESEKSGVGAGLKV
jgi:hypothetical protein